MNKKKLGTGLIALALVGVVGIGGSLAWFTDSQDATNQINLGHVDISLSEPVYSANSINGLYKTEVVPGAPIYKDPTITVETGSHDVRLRVKVEMSVTERNLTGTLQDKLDLLSIDLADNWHVDGDYLYYDGTVAAGNSLTIFKGQKDGETDYTMKIPASWDNTYVGANLQIKFTAEAIQAEYTDGMVGKNGIWNEELKGTSIQKYTVTVGGQE